MSTVSDFTNHIMIPGAGIIERSGLSLKRGMGNRGTGMGNEERGTGNL